MTTRRWPPLDLPGLHVDFGRYSHEWTPGSRWGRWLQEPHVELVCARGCRHDATGATAVTAFLAGLADLRHRGDPPTPSRKDPS